MIEIPLWLGLLLIYLFFKYVEPWLRKKLIKK